MVNDIIERWKASAFSKSACTQFVPGSPTLPLDYSVSFVYCSCHLPMPDPSPSQLSCVIATYSLLALMDRQLISFCCHLSLMTDVEFNQFITSAWRLFHPLYWPLFDWRKISLCL